MEYNGIERNGIKWSGMKWSEMEKIFHSIVWIFLKKRRTIKDMWWYEM
jgi:hypothetical protein